MMERTSIGEINSRFFFALAKLIERRAILSMLGFCFEMNVDRGSLYRARREPAKHSVPANLFGELVERHGISGDWLLTGRGSMWREHPLPPPPPDIVI